ncbi:MAG TPA: hypothetical protein VGQ32_06100 [Thermoanaerobaculia bacterium]|jgi:hypothetical protein|nr:hypothetical protein [Thermoanaerobaculia bacterium]
MRTDKHPNASLPWVIVFASAAVTLASSTQRLAHAPARPLPSRAKAASGVEPECGASCPCPRPEPPDPAAAPPPRQTWIRA